MIVQESAAKPEGVRLGRLALSRGFCTEQQLVECMYEWGKASSGSSLLTLLVEKGYVTPEQEAQLLGKEPGAKPSPPKKKGEGFFGDIAVRKGFTTRERLNECLEEQKKKGIPLGALMVMKGYLTLKQVEEITGAQKTKIVHCPGCKLAFSLKTVTESAKVACPKCKKPLRDGPLGGAAPAPKTQKAPPPASKPKKPAIMHCPSCRINYPQDGSEDDDKPKCIRCQTPLAEGRAPKVVEPPPPPPTPEPVQKNGKALPVAGPVPVNGGDEPVAIPSGVPSAKSDKKIDHGKNGGMAILEYSLDGKRVEQYEIVKEVTTLGRSPLCDVPLVDFMLSRCHCEIRYTPPGIYKLVDLKSKNGTYLNKRPVGSSDLTNGDTITLGEVVAVFKMKKKKK